MKPGDTVYRARMNGATVQVEATTILRAGPRLVVLVDNGNLGAWSYRTNVSPDSCAPTRREALADLLVRCDAAVNEAEKTLEARRAVSALVVRALKETP